MARSTLLAAAATLFVIACSGISLPLSLATPKPTELAAQVLVNMRAQTSGKIRVPADGGTQLWKVQKPDRVSLEFSGPQGVYHWIVIGKEQWFRNGPSADAWRPWSKRPGPPHVMNADLIRFVVGGDLHDVITDALSAPTIQAQGREPCAAGECLVLNYVNRTPSYVVTFWVDPATKLIVKAIIPVGTWEWFDYGVPNELKPPI